MSKLIVEGPVKKVLNAAGWVNVGRESADTYEQRVDLLNALLETLYVDNRRGRQVKHLEEARRLAQSLK